MKASVLNKIFRAEIKKTLGPKGFKKKGDIDVLDVGGYQYNLFYVFYNYGFQKVSFVFASGLEKYANAMYYCKSREEYIEEKVFPSTFVIDRNYLEKNNKGIGSFLVTNEEEGQQAIEKIIDYFLNVFIPEAEQYNTLEKFEKMYNESWYYDTLFDSPSREYKLIDGLVLAKYISERRYTEIKKKQAASLTARNPNHQYKIWENAIDILDNHSIAEIESEIANILEQKKEEKKLAKMKKKQAKENPSLASTPPIVSSDPNVIDIIGFDVDGEPEIRKEDDGSLTVMFNFMPPINGNEEQVENEVFDEFDKFLADLLEVEVIWDDRERFVIPNPKSDTIDKLKTTLEHFWD